MSIRATFLPATRSSAAFSPRRGARTSFALAAVALLAACGGEHEATPAPAPAVEPPAVVAPTPGAATPLPEGHPAPSGEPSPTPVPSPASHEVSIAVTIADAGVDETEAPRSDVTVRAIVGGQPATLLERRFLSCDHQEPPPPDDLAAVHCWWAGGGDMIDVRRDGDAIVVIHREEDEGANDLPAREVARFAVPPGARVSVAPH